MFKKNLDNKFTWLDAAMLAAAVALAVAPAYSPDTAVTKGDLAGLPEREVGEGHGNYCAVPDQEGVYFYDRDLGDGLRSFDAFADWCERVDGELGWSE